MGTVTIEGRLPFSLGITKKELLRSALFFAGRSGGRIRTPFRNVTVVLQGDTASAEVHRAINGVEGPTDVVTQRYDPIPGEEDGVYGEIYVNCDQALRASPKRRGWSPAKELLLYTAHGFDHLSGADDADDFQRLSMRRRELRWIRELDGADKSL